MIIGFDRISVIVPDLEGATQAFEGVTGRQPVWSGQRDGRNAVWFGFENGLIECLSGTEDEAGIAGLVFLSDDLQGDLLNTVELEPGTTDEDGLHEFNPEKTRGIKVGLTDGSLSASLRVRSDTLAGDQPHALDHVVLNTVDGDSCVNLFGDAGLGIRLALDNIREQWGGRMIFFRTGSMSLEIIEPLDPAKKEGRHDRFWGIAYRVSDIDAMHDRLTGAGVGVSGVRDGRKPGTRVATLKSHSLGLPSLLIEHQSA